jgi:methyl-accepting chemotaxis protein
MGKGEGWMKLNRKLLISNVGIPLLIVLGVMAYIISSDVGRLVESRSKDYQHAAEYFAAIVDRLIGEKSQYLQDQARAAPTIELYYSAIQSFDEADWLRIPAYRAWKESFAAGEKQEGDVIRTYLGYKGIKPALGKSWLNLDPGYHAYSEPWYLGVTELNDTFLTQPFRLDGGTDGKIGMTISYPIYERGIGLGSFENIIGTVAADLDMSSIEALAAELLDQTEYDISVYDFRGSMLYNKAYERLASEGKLPKMEGVPTFNDYFSGLDPRAQEGRGMSLLLEMSGRSGSLKYRWGGQDTLTGYGKAASNNLTVMATAPLSRAIGPQLKQRVMEYLLIVALLLLVLAAGTIVISLTIVKNIQVANKALRGIAQADADMTRKLALSSKDEIGELGSSFDFFIEKLRELVIGVKSVISETIDINTQISASTEETSSSVTEITAIFESMGKEIGALESSLSRTVSSIERISASVSSVDRQIAGQASMVEESTAAITQMISSLENVDRAASAKQAAAEGLNVLAAEGRAQIEDTRQVFMEVVARIESIQEMVDTVNAIASQTNLLSMNAAIEAAHAGDSGKGFAVVAEEIRKLAGTASEASLGITALIKDVTESVSRTEANVLETAQTFDGIRAGIGGAVDAFTEIRHAVAELTVGGKEVLAASQQINEVTSAVRSGSSEIAQGTRSILESSEGIRDAASHVNGGIAEMNQGNKEIMRAMQNMVDLSLGLDRLVKRLDEKFGEFKT